MWGRCHWIWNAAGGRYSGRWPWLLIEGVPGVKLPPLNYWPRLSMRISRAFISPDFMPSDAGYRCTTRSHRSSSLSGPIFLTLCWLMNQSRLTKTQAALFGSDGRTSGYDWWHHLPNESTLFGSGHTKPKSNTRAPIVYQKPNSIVSIQDYCSISQRRREGHHHCAPQWLARWPAVNEVQPVLTKEDIAAFLALSKQVHVEAPFD